jgi:hypothetical protein
VQATKVSSRAGMKRTLMDMGAAPLLRYGFTGTIWGDSGGSARG